MKSNRLCYQNFLKDCYARYYEMISTHYWMVLNDIIDNSSYHLLLTNISMNGSGSSQYNGTSILLLTYNLYAQHVSFNSTTFKLDKSCKNT